MLTGVWDCCACCRAAARCVWGRSTLPVGVLVVVALPSRGSEAVAAQG